MEDQCDSRAVDVLSLDVVKKQHYGAAILQRFAQGCSSWCLTVQQQHLFKDRRHLLSST